MAQTIQLRRGTAAQWATANPTLAQGELGVETDTGLYKIGNGATAWNALAYVGLSPELGVSTISAAGEEPSTPAAGKLRLYARSYGGRILPKIKGPSGLDTALQPGFFGNGISMILPGTAAIMNVQGGPAATVVGTMTHPNLAATSLRTQMSRANVISAAAAASAAEVRSAFARVYLGDQPGRGGFFARFRFSLPTTVALQRSFFGLMGTTAALSTSLDPTVQANLVGIGNASGDTNLQIITNGAEGTALKVDLGVNFPSAGAEGDIFDLTMFAKPNATEVGYKVARSGVVEALVEGSLATKLPVSTTFLAPHAYINNGGTAAAVQFDLSRIYIETDY